TGRMEACVVSSTGLREHRIRLSGLLREYQRKSAFQLVPSVVRCAASWNPMHARNLLPSDRACRPKANLPNCIINKHSTSGHGRELGLQYIMNHDPELWMDNV